MAQPDKSPRIGRSQGASIFWGLVSLFFAAAACFYFLKNLGTENNANKLRDEVLFLQDQCDTLKAQTAKLEADQNQAQADLKNRSDFLDDKEAKLSEMASHLEGLTPQSQNQSPAAPLPNATDKKFAQVIRKLGKDSNNDVVMHNGRPLLRINNPALFAAGDASLKPEGRTLLDQIANVVDGVAPTYELRVECFTDIDAEIQKPSGPPPKPSNVQKKDDPDKAPDVDAPKPRYGNSWELTAARAATIARYFHDQTSLPSHDVLVIARGDSEPVVTDPKENQAPNQRIEITLVPAAPALHVDTPVNPLTPPPEPPPPAKKDN